MLRSSRFYILLFSFLLSLVLYTFVQVSYAQGSVQTIRLVQVYALTAVSFLYLTLFIGPFNFLFPHFPFKKALLHARRALGIATCYYALLHGLIAFYGLLGGFEGVLFLSDRYLINVLLGFSSLLILCALAVTSVDAFIKKAMYPGWKLLHQLIYVAGLFILVHALMLGSHFQTFSEIVPQIFFAALGVLLFLEALRVDAFLQKNFRALPHFGFVTSLILGGIVTFYVASALLPKADSPLSIHNRHIQLAKDAQQNVGGTNIPALPGMDGDKTKRYTTSFLHEDGIEPNQATELQFRVFDASSGNRVHYYKTLYDKPVHLIIVDSSLTYFNHIHPEVSENGFLITTQFPKAGEYHLYLDFQPVGAIEQQVAFTLTVGDQRAIIKPAGVPDKLLKKTFGAYQVTLQAPKPLLASQLSVGNQQMTFTILDKTGKPVTTLKPYLAAYGHLVMINQETYEYLHVHPTNVTPPAPDANGGPTVTFMPLGLYGPIKPGIYRVFAQFNPDNKLFTADYTIAVQ